MKKIELSNWKRRKQYEHFRKLEDPYFGLVTSVDVEKCYNDAKKEECSFFARYLHKCLIAINKVENLKYRIINDEVFEVETVHASATIAREDETFAFSFINFDESFKAFNENFLDEKKRVKLSDAFYPLYNGSDCIHCSALPWMKFISHKEPRSGHPDSVPKLAFSKVYEERGRKQMNISINVNHALVDGIHVGKFYKYFQEELLK